MKKPDASLARVWSSLIPCIAVLPDHSKSEAMRKLVSCHHTEQAKRRDILKTGEYSRAPLKRKRRREFTTERFDSSRIRRSLERLYVIGRGMQPVRVPAACNVEHHDFLSRKSCSLCIHSSERKIASRSLDVIICSKSCLCCTRTLLERCRTSDKVTMMCNRIVGLGGK